MPTRARRLIRSIITSVTALALLSTSTVAAAQADAAPERAGAPTVIRSATAAVGAAAATASFPVTLISGSLTEAAGGSTSPAISRDGQVIAYASTSTALAPNTQGYSNIYVYDRMTRRQELISKALNGDPGNAASSYPKLSADGRYVAFGSRASNLVLGDLNGALDAFVWDRQLQTMTLVSHPPTDTTLNLTDKTPVVLSADGRHVAFNVTPNISGTAYGTSTAEYDLDTASSYLVTLTPQNKPTTYSYWTLNPSLSSDGKVVSFSSNDQAMYPAGLTYQQSQVFVRADGATSLVSVSPTGAAAVCRSNCVLSGGTRLSSTGRFVVFDTLGEDLVPNDGDSSNGFSSKDIYLRDRAAGSTRLVSSAELGFTGDSDSAEMSDDGRVVAFRSSTNATLGDNDSNKDIYLWDGANGTAALVTQWSSSSYMPALSADGGTLAFVTDANVGGADENGSADVYVVDTQLGGPNYVGPVLSRETAGGSNPAEKNDCLGQCSDPVDLDTGAFFDSHVDLTIPGRGPTLNFTRTYDTRRAGIDGRLGYGWTDSYDWLLSTAVDGTVTIRQDNGSETVFTQDGSGRYGAPPRVLASLAKESDGTWTYTIRKQQTYRFDGDGKLTAIRDLNGYTTTLTYSGGRLITVTDPAGRNLTMGYGTDGRLATVTDPLPRTVTFIYDMAGNLATVKDVDSRTIGYGYDGAHRVTSVTDPMDKALANEYDSAGRVKTQTDRNGHTMAFDYSSVAADGSHGTTITHARGNKQVFEYVSGRVVAVTGGAGTAQAAITTYGYDVTTNSLARVSDPLGHVMSSRYDADGNRLSSTDALGHTTTWTYNGFGQVLTATDPLQHTTTSTYDGNGNLRTVTRRQSSTAAASVVTYLYEDAAHPGDVTGIRDPNGHVTVFDYDANGNRSSITDATGRKTTTAFNVVGWETRSVSPDGNRAGGVPAQHTTSFGDFTGFGAPRTVTDPLGHATTYVYDADQRLTDRTDPNGHHSHVTYNGGGQATQVKRADDTTILTGYDANNHLATQSDALGRVTKYGYDAFDRLSTTTDPLNRVTSRGYDAAGRLRTLTQPGSGSATLTTTHAYDDADRLTKVEYSDGTTAAISYTYDDAGQRITMSDDTGTSTFTVNDWGDLTQVKDGAGKTVGYGYDPAGRITRITYPDSAGDIVRGYDDAGRLTSVTDWANRTTTFDYAADGALAGTHYPNGVTTTAGWDAAGAAASTTYGTASTTLGTLTYGRDPGGLLRSETTTGSSLGPTRTFTYDALDRIKTENTAAYGYDDGDNLVGKGGIVQSFDAAHQQLTRATTAGVTYQYDARGNRVQASSPTLADANTFGYDQANELTKYTRSLPATSATYRYDGDGLRTGKKVGTTSYGFVYDRAQTLPLILSDGTNRYVYGPGGQPIAQVAIASGTVGYLHADQLGSIRLITNAAGAVAGRATYTAYGSRTTTGSASPFGFTGQYTDSESGLLYLRARFYDPTTGQFLTRDPAVAGTRAAYAYARGNPLSLTDPSGLVGVGLCQSFTFGVIVSVSAGGCLVGVWSSNGDFQLGLTVTQEQGGVLPLDIGTSLTGSLSSAQSLSDYSGKDGYLGLSVGEGIGTAWKISGTKCPTPGQPTVATIEGGLWGGGHFPVPFSVSAGQADTESVELFPNLWHVT